MKEPVDAELKSRLESLGQGVEAGLHHILEIGLNEAAKIKEAAPAIVLVRSRPRDWVCSVCDTGMLTTNHGVFVHVCESQGVYHDG